MMTAGVLPQFIRLDLPPVSVDTTLLTLNGEVCVGDIII